MGVTQSGMESPIGTVDIQHIADGDIGPRCTSNAFSRWGLKDSPREKGEEIDARCYDCSFLDDFGSTLLRTLACECLAQG
jgi:hypothetical protein